MATVERSLLIQRDPAAVFALLADVDRYPEFLRGFTRWEPIGAEHTGVDARFRVLMQVGAIEAGSVLRTVAWEEPRTIAWRSERGIDHRGHWLVEPRASGSQLTMEISFELEGHLRWIVERLTARIVDRNVQATLLAARRLLERPGGSPART
jgi:ribosome-associated toxin RatA of RatAB toxin-antitoxin module